MSVELAAALAALYITGALYVGWRVVSSLSDIVTVNTERAPRPIAFILERTRRVCLGPLSLAGVALMLVWPVGVVMWGGCRWALARFFATWDMEVTVQRLAPLITDLANLDTPTQEPTPVLVGTPYFLCPHDAHDADGNPLLGEDPLPDSPTGMFVAGPPAWIASVRCPCGAWAHVYDEPARGPLRIGGAEPVHPPRDVVHARGAEAK